MPQTSEEWRQHARKRITDYWEVLERQDVSKELHNRRNGLYGDDYVRPGASIEIPLFWGTF